MFPKYQRLLTKDVLFLTKKKNYFSYGFFGFFYTLQYSNRSYNQLSFHVSIKYNKHSTARNLIKRAVLKKAEKLNTQGIFANYWKVFVVLNKNKIPLLQKEFENMEQKDIILHIQNHFAQSFIALSKHLGNSSATSSTMGKRS